ncbi:MAG TPA: hypothetical protein VL754_05675 [Verrucomicrobiae bacterium]|nr:hypothetical protein [Verrucomicrobiae bacterium]
MAIDLDIQWIWLDDVKVCLSARTRGTLTVEDFEKMLQSFSEAFLAIDAPAILDLRQARWDLGAADIVAIVSGLTQAGLGVNNKIALLCARDIDHYGQLMVMASAASNRGIKARAFYDFDGALKWLANDWND